MQAEWRSASMECGELCVMISGIVMMPGWCAGNLGTEPMEVKLGEGLVT